MERNERRLLRGLVTEPSPRKKTSVHLGGALQTLLSFNYFELDPTHTMKAMQLAHHLEPALLPRSAAFFFSN